VVVDRAEPSLCTDAPSGPTERAGARNAPVRLPRGSDDFRRVIRERRAREQLVADWLRKLAPRP